MEWDKGINDLEELDNKNHLIVEIPIPMFCFPSGSSPFKSYLHKGIQSIEMKNASRPTLFVRAITL